jgi:20S proteasome alpha/beta subunit
VQIIGGIDDAGPSLHIIDGDGVPQRVGFAALGSGSTDAIAMMESLRHQWKSKKLRQQKQKRLESHINGNNSHPNVTEVHRNIGIEGSCRSSIGSSSSQLRYIEDVDIENAIDAVRRSVRAGKKRRVLVVCIRYFTQ